MVSRNGERSCTSKNENTDISWVVGVIQRNVGDALGYMIKHYR